jgi:small-conductance mechanosensitive channel
MNTRPLQKTIVVYFLVAAAIAVAKDSPVVFNGRTLFTIQAGVGSFGPEARAQAVEDRLTKLSRNPLAKIDSLTVTESETTSDIAAGDVIILSVTEADARAAGRPRHVLAAEYAKILQMALGGAREEHSFKERAKDVALSLLITVIFILALRYLQIGVARLRLLLESWGGTRIRAIRLQRLELLTAQQIVWALTTMANALQAGMVLVTLYFYLSLVLSVFPSTRALSATLFAYLDSGLRVAGSGLAAYAPSLLMIALIAVLTRYTIKACRYFFHGVETGMLTVPGFYREWADPTYKIVRFLVLAVAAVVMFPYIPGHDSSALKGVSIFFGLLFSLGSAGAVGNLVAGVLLTYTRAFQLGDRVRIADTLGDVTEKTLLATHVRTVKNEDITIPNSLVLSSHIVNFSSRCREGGLILHTSVTIGYDAPWRQIHQLLVSAALATKHILKDPQPFVLQTALDDFYVNYQINAYTDQPGQMMGIYSELHQNIQDTFNEAGVEICSPHFSALRDGNRIAIPDNYVSRTYNTPGFRVFAAANGGARTEGAAKYGS